MTILEIFIIAGLIAAVAGLIVDNVKLTKRVEKLEKKEILYFNMSKEDIDELDKIVIDTNGAKLF
jgi:hypothetical protein